MELAVYTFDVDLTVLVYLSTNVWGYPLRTRRILKMEIMALKLLCSVLVLRYPMHSPRISPLKTDLGWLEL